MSKSMINNKKNNELHIVKDNLGREYLSGATHDGIFHADDVLATAMLRTIDNDFKVERIPRGKQIDDENILVFDIGHGKYDHHQNEGENLFVGEHKRAACGLIFDGFYKALHCEKIYDEFQPFIYEVEDVDNGVEGSKSLFASIINSYNPSIEELDGLTYDEQTSLYNEKFEEAVSFAKAYFIQKFNSLEDKRLTKITENFIKSFSNGILDEFKQESMREITNDTLRKMLSSKGNTLSEIVNNSNYFEDDVKDRLSKTFERIDLNFDSYEKFAEGINDRELLSKSMERYFNKVITNTLEDIAREEEILKDFEKMEDGANYIILSNPNGRFKKFIIEELNEKRRANIDFAIFYGDRSNAYIIECIPPDVEHMFSQRIPLPEEIRGLSNQGEKSSIEDAKILDDFSPNIVFVHPTGFCGGCKDLKSAIALVEKTTELAKENTKTIGFD